MASPPILYAAITLVIALICGLAPIFSKFKEDLGRLKVLTGIAAGIIIASAMLVVIPNGYELASSEEHEEHVDGLLLGGAILGGFLLMFILEGSGIGHAVHEEHHDHTHDMCMFITTTADGCWFLVYHFTPPQMVWRLERPRQQAVFQ